MGGIPIIPVYHFYGPFYYFERRIGEIPTDSVYHFDRRIGEIPTVPSCCFQRISEIPTGYIYHYDNRIDEIPSESIYLSF